MRTDLPVEQQLVQAVHAAHEAGIKYGDSDRINAVVVCEANSELRLQQVIKKLDNKNIPLVRFYEPDIGNQLTAVATSPLTVEEKKCLSKFRLWRYGK